MEWSHNQKSYRALQKSGDVSILGSRGNGRERTAIKGERQLRKENERKRRDQVWKKMMFPGVKPSARTQGVVTGLTRVERSTPVV